MVDVVESISHHATNAAATHRHASTSSRIPSTQLQQSKSAQNHPDALLQMFNMVPITDTINAYNPADAQLILQRVVPLAASRLVLSDSTILRSRKEWEVILSHTRAPSVTLHYVHGNEVTQLHEAVGPGSINNTTTLSLTTTHLLHQVFQMEAPTSDGRENKSEPATLLVVGDVTVAFLFAIRVHLALRQQGLQDSFVHVALQPDFCCRFITQRSLCLLSTTKATKRRLRTACGSLILFKPNDLSPTAPLARTSFLLRMRALTRQPTALLLRLHPTRYSLLQQTPPMDMRPLSE